MGDMADATLNGLYCSGCGELFEDLDEPGHPRYCSAACEPAGYQRFAPHPRKPEPKSEARKQGRKRRKRLGERRRKRSSRKGRARPDSRPR